MTTPNERLTRMRESFEKDKRVLAEDFITPDNPKPHVSISRSKAAHKLVEQLAPKSPKRS
jgi:hypothetical protein